MFDMIAPHCLNADRKDQSTTETSFPYEIFTGVTVELVKYSAGQGDNTEKTQASAFAAPPALWISISSGR